MSSDNAALSVEFNPWSGKAALDTAKLDPGRDKAARGPVEIGPGRGKAARGPADGPEWGKRLARSGMVPVTFG